MITKKNATTGGEREMKTKGFCEIKKRGASAKKYTTAILNIWSKSTVQKQKIGQTTLFRCEVDNQKELQLGGESHFHNHLVVQYFLVRSRPFKSLLIGDVT